MQRAWNKYWSTSFEFSIIEVCAKENLLKREQFWLDWTKSYEVSVGYNLAPTAGNSLGVKHSEETKTRMSEAKKKMTPETKQRMRLNRLGKKHTEEQKDKISKGLIGRTHSEETKAKMSSSQKGRKLSKERIAQMSAYNTGRKRGKYKTKMDKLMENMTAPAIGY